MHQQRRHRCRDKGGEQNVRRGGPEGERRARGERERTARQTGTWLWQERVRAEENQGRRSPRCAKHAGWGRFLATGEDWQNRVARGGGADPKRATKGRHATVCPELFGFWSGSDTRAWPVLRRAIAPQVESTGYTEHMLRPHAGPRADRLSGRPGLAWR